MKNFLYIACVIILSGCAGTSKDGEPCFEFQTFEVLQGLENGALAYAYECPWYESLCFDKKLVVHLTSPKGVDYYDNQKISSTSTTCWIQDGVYRYTTKEDIMRTAPNLKLVEK
ncbi:MAG: hypothetical protein GX944_00105 [Alphaproteobacteria bacterium]|nr:hypothetical protein [Alphaproteobacteria bacterium]